MIRKINDIFVTEAVSFPRCGHHWMVNILSLYFEQRLNYCEKYLCPEKIIDICPTTNLQKNHDFDLKSTINTDRRYIIQIRNKHDALHSYFKLNHYDIDMTYNKNYDKKVDMEKVYKNYIESYNINSNYYDGFINKWVLNYVPNSIIVIYDYLKYDTFNTMCKVINHISDDKIDSDKLNKCILELNRF